MLTHPVAPFRDIAWQRPNPLTQALLATPGLVLTIDARSALYQVFRELGRAQRREVLLPAFHCPTIVTSAISAGLTPRFYRVRRDLSVDMDSVNALVGDTTAAMLVIHFFGHATDLTPMAALRARGVAMIEDWSHSFLEAKTLKLTGHDDSYRVYSFWKLVPSLLGGGLIRPAGAPAPMAAPPHARTGLTTKHTLSHLKSLFEAALMQGQHPRLGWAYSRFESLRAAMKAAPASIETTIDLRVAGEHYYRFDPAQAYARMPAAALRVIAATDLHAVAKRRLHNHAVYAQVLNHSAVAVPVTASIPAAVPWVFAVMVNDRDRYDTLWRAQGVPLHTFGPFLHSRLMAEGEPRAVSDARFLADRLLCLSIHQDVDEAQIRAAYAVIQSCEPPTSGADAT